MSRIFRGLIIGKSKVKRIIILTEEKIRKRVKEGDNIPQDIVIEEKLILLKLSKLL